MFRPMLKMQCFFCLFIVFCEIAIGQDGTPSDQFVPLEMVGGVYDSRYKPLSAVWKLRKTEFRKRIYTLKGEVRVANEGDHPIEFSVPNDFVLVTLRNSKGESVVQAKDLLPPTEPAMNGIAHLSAFREVEFLKNGVHQKGAGRELIKLERGENCSSVVSLNWNALKVDPQSILPPDGTLERWTYQIRIAIVVPGTSGAIFKTRDIPIVAGDTVK